MELVSILLMVAYFNSKVKGTRSTSAYHQMNSAMQKTEKSMWKSEVDKRQMCLAWGGNTI